MLRPFSPGFSRRLSVRAPFSFLEISEALSLAEMCGEPYTVGLGVRRALARQRESQREVREWLRPF